MNRLGFILFSGLLFLSSFTALHAVNAKGILVYLDGTVEIHKNGEITGPKSLNPGFELEDYDLLETGSDGSAEFDINTFISDGTYDRISVKIENNTSVYFKTSVNQDDGFLQLILFTGGITVNTGKLSSGINMTVRAAGNAVIKVNDAEFGVLTAPDGSILVTCYEGSLECGIAPGIGSGSAFTEKAFSGMIVDVIQGRHLKIVDISPEMFDVYKTEWSAEKLRMFRAGSFSLTKPVIIKYEEYLEKYNLFYKEFRGYDKIFRKYKDLNIVPEKPSIPDDNNSIISKSDNSAQNETVDENMEMNDIIADKMKVSPAILRMRNVFFTYEELFYRIKEIKSYHDQVPVKGSLRKKYDIDDFMKDFQKNYKAAEKKNSYVRQSFNIYSKMDSAGLN